MKYESITKDKELSCCVELRLNGALTLESTEVCRIHEKMNNCVVDYNAVQIAAVRVMDLKLATEKRGRIQCVDHIWMSWKEVLQFRQ